MAKITVLGDAIVITSTLKMEELVLIEKYRPEALTLMGGEDGKEPMFRVSTTKSGTGKINKYGAEFGGETRDANKYATITALVDTTDDDIKEAVADALGKPLVLLNKLETQLAEVVKEIAAEKDAIIKSITVTQ